MWQRFTERARRIVFFAQEEAGRLGENYVSTEHLLLGLVRENDTVAARILDRIGVSLGRVRSEIERQVARGDGRLAGDMQLTPSAKRVIDLAYDEARQLNNNYIGSEHLLLGLVRADEGLAGRVLSKLGVDLERTREAVIALQNPATETSADADQGAADPGSSFVALPDFVNRRLTEPGRQVFRLAHAEAMRLGQYLVSTEHLLLGITRRNDAVAARILVQLGVSLDQVRSRIEDRASRGDAVTNAELKPTPQVLRVAELAYDEARQLNNNYIGTEHLLLGLLREGEGLAAQVLSEFGLDLESTRQAIAHVEDAPCDETPPAPTPTPQRPRMLVGSTGIVMATAGRGVIEMAVDRDAYAELDAVFQARDDYGYREMRDEGRFALLPTGTKIKVLNLDAGGRPVEPGVRVRVLDGEFAGRAGWVPRVTVEILPTNADPLPPFPPE